MKTIIKTILIIFLISGFLSCGDTSKHNSGDLDKMKARLESLKKQKTDLDLQIDSLEKSIAAIDTSFSNQKPKLVSVDTVILTDFKHYINFQGIVDAKNVSYVTPAGQPGQIKAIYVKEGDFVKKGQLVLKLDNSVALENVNAIRQQLSTVQTQLDLAKSVYQRQKNLWDNNIGTELQLLQAKTNMESLEGQMKTIEANVKAAALQASQGNVYSDISGTIDEVTARVGETFTGNPAAGGYIKIVSSGNVKVSVIIPENYSDRVRKGSHAIVHLPDYNKSFEATISFLSQTIGANNRGFVAEINIPSGLNVKPNQTVVVSILDYEDPNALSVPLNIIQNDENGKYVLIVKKEKENLMAQKQPIQIGQYNGDRVQVTSGLHAGDVVITGGYQNVFAGQLLTIGQSNSEL